ncbi:MAG: hypothetical protein E5X94_00620 [Mesorhizobium sp.]|uniref:hypothetical protein n=1 Tax=unclassified Mesorhizobium TaxID=325217 RepID=UPI000FCBE812|nr:MULTISPECIES: hypothetical protein [unclassified Mesorhizobium]RUW04047.1 hypothetical protein EOA49_00530 [Mesorhizobium sp. M1A.F.Ca.IN.020.04.1.1]RUW04110.1 hypothetical protein EOA49_00865 [Mesorhizobium sp. M1A.F.Ca.IN.020.04.1.1]TIN82754.1 MAG: hypothetical protein E5X97_29045 [Mesorhizobium sp.]TIN88342.1 MAG: hypothetical protein E5X94_00620 [Mesorhizobium sp.]TIO59106.1 MAG: hypothetical protein E5Y00_25080 [Mesorhizobium sp.]
MTRVYVSIKRVPRTANIDENVDGEDYLARTVYEDFELIDTGVLDSDGNPIKAHEKMDPVGFIRWGNR